ncbi:MAG: hypothetical protein WHS44_10825 [Fimbriimonadales bacterium]
MGRGRLRRLPRREAADAPTPPQTLEDAMKLGCLLALLEWFVWDILLALWDWLTRRRSRP